MWALPTTTVTILRGTSIDEYSGTISNESTVASAVSASIMEQGRTVDDPNSGTPRVIRIVTGRVASTEDVKRNDRLRDEGTNLYYMVTSVRQVQNPIVTMDKVLELMRVDSTNP